MNFSFACHFSSSLDDQTTETVEECDEDELHNTSEEELPRQFGEYQTVGQIWSLYEVRLLPI